MSVNRHPFFVWQWVIIKIIIVFLSPIMSRILAIDYGRKRTGVAVSDAMQIIANGLTTVPTHELLDFITGYVQKEPVERILVGLPKQMNNEASESMKYIDPFVRSLKKRLPALNRQKSPFRVPPKIPIYTSSKQLPQVLPKYFYSAPDTSYPITLTPA